MATARLVAPVVIGAIRKHGRNCAIRLVFAALVLVSISLTVFTNIKVMSHDDEDHLVHSAPILRNLTQSQSLPTQAAMEPSHPPAPPSSTPPPHQNISIRNVEGTTIPDGQWTTETTVQNKPLEDPTNQTIDDSSLLQKAANLARPPSSTTTPHQNISIRNVEGTTIPDAQLTTEATVPIKPLADPTNQTINESSTPQKAATLARPPSSTTTPQNISIGNVEGTTILDAQITTEATVPNKPLADPTNQTTDDSSILLKQPILDRRIPRQRRQRPLRPKRRKITRAVQEHELERQLGLTLDFSDFDSEALHQSLYDFYNIPTMNNISYLWDDPQCLLPDWMIKYLRWHTYMRTSTTIFTDGTSVADGKQPVKFIVMQCLATDDHCGGVSDRLKPLPFLLRIAYYTKRMLFIYWNRPGHLEEFLVPPKAGMDWRLPSWLVPMVKNWSEGAATFSFDTLRGWSRTEVVMVRSRYQDYHGGMYLYNEHLMEGEIDFVSLFHHLWKVAFTPSPPVRKILESDMRLLGLVPGQYVGAHLRALYGLDFRQDNILRNWARNAMNCASELRPRKPIFFVSDSDIATRYARDYAIKKKATIITRTPNPDPPLHIDKVHLWRTRNMSDFYDAFVDIYIMGHADCLTYNKGGYGIMGLFLSRNASCGLRQDAIDTPLIHKPCKWVDDPLNGTEATRSSTPINPVVSNESIYMEPMDTDWNPIWRGT